MPKLWRWISVVPPSIIPLRSFAELIRTATCMVLKAKANDRHTSSDEFHGSRSDNVRQVALETTTTVIQTFFMYSQREI
ncbi:hypothetical protein TNCV_978551 [Trichonephila clavipes]|nr:hypothetical protein TNCV_978551 [Trichonephila clavipes]